MQWKRRAQGLEGTAAGQACDYIIIMLMICLSTGGSERSRLSWSSFSALSYFQASKTLKILRITLLRFVKSDQSITVEHLSRSAHHHRAVTRWESFIALAVMENMVRHDKTFK